MKEYSDPFFAEIRVTSVGTFEVTIPINTIKFEGWKKGDKLRLVGKKVRLK